MISFTFNVKNEVATNTLSHSENMAMLSAILRNSGIYSKEKVVVTTENSKVAKRVYVLLNDLYNIQVSIEDRNSAFNRNRLYLISFEDKIDFILEDLSVIDNNGNYLEIVNDYLLGSEEEIRAYLMGVFLSCGSVNDPKTSRYHLEFFFDSEKEALFVSQILNSFNLNSKIIPKDKKKMVYIKEAEKIGDFLRIINAYQAVMYFEDIRIYRDHKNMTNRLNNMEQANIEKAINTCNEQIENINIILDAFGKDVLDERIQEVITYRLKYPESSLQELSEIMSLEIGKNITKSGLNHRFRKIKEMANRIKSQKGDKENEIL